MAVSALANTQQVIQNLSMLNNQANTLEQQITTGDQSTTFSGIAPQAEQLVNLTATQAQQQGYINTINTVDTTLQSASLATTTITNLVQQFGSELQTDAFDQTGATVQSQAQSLLAQIGDYLNTEGPEGYIFGGSDTTTPPFDASGLPNPGDLTTQVNGAPPNGYYQGNDQEASAQVDTDLNVQYGVSADNPAFEQVIRVLNFLANSGTLSASNPTDVANVNQAQTILTTATNQLQQLTANIGEQQTTLSDTLQAHQQSLTLANSNIANITQVNSAQVITQLDSLQTQLEASYQTVNMLQNLSLANYLK